MKFIESAKRGESVYLHQVKQEFDREGTMVGCTLVLPGGETKLFEIGLIRPDGAEEEEFIRSYFYARIYNIISMLGGTKMIFTAPKEEYIAKLLHSLDDAFGVHVPKKDRMGYAKCLNVTDRMNTALGEEPFRFELGGEAHKPIELEDEHGVDIVEEFKRAVEKCAEGLIFGMDIGGTDIKVVGARYGRIDHIKEYDWNPSGFKSVNGIIDAVMLLARLSRALLSLDDDAELPGDILKLKEGLLRREASYEYMKHGVRTLEGFIGRLRLLDGIGISFPDVVVRDKIVGGETHKTKGAREFSPDYESEFRHLTALNVKLKELCLEGGSVHMTNDGNMAAYTAAVELAYSSRADEVHCGMFAHTLGTELGTGWVNEKGCVPEYPLEVYNCIIDLGNFIAKSYPAIDVRSLNNFNTGLSGTLQRFTGQSGAFRLAEEYYRDNAPKLYKELFDEGYIAHTGANSMVAATEPVDLRKAFLEHLMGQAERGEAQACRIFENIGECLGATWLETEAVLCPAAKSRVLYGRFVKRLRCFELMLQGARKVVPDIELFAADDELAFTPLMCELRDNPMYSVAQFGQAVGSVYFAASVL